MKKAIQHPETVSLRSGIKKAALRPSKNVNIPERVLSFAAGAWLLMNGLSKHRGRPFTAIPETLSGGLLIFRGLTGFCPVYSALGKNSINMPAITIREQIDVQSPRDQVYAFWRKLENLPKFMKHLSSVEERDEKRSHWRANLPGEIVKLSWNAELTREEENTFIGWHSVEGSMVENAGKVGFSDSPDGIGTRLKIDISYLPPAGSLGQGIARLLNGIFEKMIREDVLSFARYAESENYKTANEPENKAGKAQNTFR